MSKDLFIILFIVVVAGFALLIPYAIDLFINHFPTRKRAFKPKKQRNSRQEFYSKEFESEEIYEADEITPDPEEEGDSFSSNIYICPECGSLKLRMSEGGKIKCSGCGQVFAINGDFNQNLH